MTMNKKTALCMALAATTLLAGCGGGKSGGNGGSTVELIPANFETGEDFITFADLPPNPLEPEKIAEYRDIGMNKFLLTEDYGVSLTANAEGNELSTAYVTALGNAKAAGMEVWVRNYRNDEDYFQNKAASPGCNYGSDTYTRPQRDLTTQFAAYDQITGFFMSDEPFMWTLEDDPATAIDESLYPAMDKYQKLIDWKNEYYPDAYWHMNHVPSSSWDHWNPDTANVAMYDKDGDGEVTYDDIAEYDFNKDTVINYADFIQYYIDNIIKKLEGNCGRTIGFDRYPLLSGGLDASYLYDVLTVASLTKNYNDTAAEGQKANFGLCIQTQEYLAYDLRDLTTPGDVTLQLYTGMAMGVGLYEYFLYGSFHIGETIQMNGIMDINGNKRIYDLVKEANDKALPFAKVVRAFDWQGTLASPAVSEDNRAYDYGFTKAQNLLIDISKAGVLQGVESRFDAIVGTFKQGQQDGYMVVNFTDPQDAKTNTVTLDFGNCTKAIVYRDGVGEVVNLVQGKLRLTLPAGDGAFVIPA